MARRLLDRFPPLAGASSYVARSGHERQVQADGEVTDGRLVIARLLGRAQHVVKVGHGHLDVQLRRQAGKDQE